MPNDFSFAPHENDPTDIAKNPIKHHTSAAASGAATGALAGVGVGAWLGSGGGFKRMRGAAGAGGLIGAGLGAGLGYHRSEKKQRTVEQMYGGNEPFALEKLSALDAYAAGRAFAYQLAKQAAENSGFVPPEAVQNAAKKGLELHQQGRSGDGLQPQTVSEAKSMAAGEKLSLEKIRRMNAWFARHASDEKAGWDKAGQETPGYVAWLLWGGDAGRRWAAGLAETDDD